MKLWKTITTPALVGGMIAATILPASAVAVQRFTDVPDTHPHADSVYWAAENGIAQGCETGRFCEEWVVTRAMLTTFLKNLAESGAVDAGTVAGLTIEDLDERYAATAAGVLTFAGVWDAATSYSEGQVVAHGGSSFVAVRDTEAGEAPGSDAFAVLAQAGAQGPRGLQGEPGVQGLPGVDAKVVEIEDEGTDHDDHLYDYLMDLEEQLWNLEAQVEDLEDDMVSSDDLETLEDDLEDLQNQLSGLDSQINADEGGLADTVDYLLDRADELGTDVTDLEGRVGDLEQAPAPIRSVPPHHVCFMPPSGFPGCDF